MAQRTICPNCGSPVEPGVQFCSICGHSVSEEGDQHASGERIENIGRMEYQSPGKRTTVTVVAFVILGLATLVFFLATISEMTMLQRVVDGEVVTDAEFVANDELQSIVGSLSTIAFILIVVVFCFWIHRVSKNLEPLGVMNQRFSPGWAVGWWFVPIMGFFRPYQVMKEIWTGSHSFETDISPIIGWWWALYLISSGVDQIAARGFLSSETAEDLLVADWVSLGGDLLNLVAMVLAVILIKQIASGQDVHYARLLADGELGGSSRVVPT